MRKSIYLLTTPSSHTHRFHPLPLATPTSCSPHSLATPIHSTHSPQLSSILLTCAKFKVWMTIVEWVECMGVASGCGEQEVGVASGSGWNLWVWLLGVVVRRYIDFLILLIPTPLVSVLFCSSIPTFLFIYISYCIHVLWVGETRASALHCSSYTYTVMLEKSARIKLCDLKKIAHLHIVCDFNLCDDSQG